MAITPQSNVKLLKVPLQMNNKNQLTFSNATAQYNYFNSLPSIEIDECPYQRKDNIIRFSGHIDELLQFNYCMYQNENYSNKWFYAYITNMTYENNGTTFIEIKTDVFQTWQFDLIYRKCFVEREHTNNDTIGSNIVDEALNVGEYINSANPVEIDSLNDLDNYYICMGVSELPDESIPPNNKNRIYNGVFGGLYYLAFNTPQDCQTAIKMYDFQGKGEAIYTLFMLPKNFIVEALATFATWTIASIGTCQVIYIDESSGSEVLGGMEFSLQNHVGKNYVPKNNKLFTYPFNFVNITNNSGTTIPFKFEDFDNNEMSFALYGAITPGISMKLVPLSHKNINVDYNSGIMAGKLPICPWNSDPYVNWLTQNAINIGLNVGETIGDIALNPKNALSSVSSIGSVVNSIYQADIVPMQSKGNLNAGDINFSNEKAGFTGYYTSIRDEYAKIIDDYFSMYGYKTNELKVPNITGRLNWNFVKTIECNFTGNIPQMDLQEIKDMFDDGVTLWHNPNTFLDYSQTNNII
jgi:hypothetical protein